MLNFQCNQSEILIIPPNFPNLKLNQFRHSKESFVSICTSFIFLCTSVRRYSAFQFLRDPYIANLVNFQNIEMGSKAKENHLYSFVPLLFSFVLQRVRRYSNFKTTETRQEGKSAILTTNGIRKRIVCTRLYFFYFHLYLKGFRDIRFQNFGNAPRGEIDHFKRYRNGINGIQKRVVCIRLVQFKSNLNFKFGRIINISD